MRVYCKPSTLHRLPDGRRIPNRAGASILQTRTYCARPPPPHSHTYPSILPARPSQTAEVQDKTMTLLNVISSLARASSAWELYDTNRDGVLSLEETEALINSAEISQAIELLTNTR